MPNAAKPETKDNVAVGNKGGTAHGGLSAGAMARLATQAAMPPHPHEPDADSERSASRFRHGGDDGALEAAHSTPDLQAQTPPQAEVPAGAGGATEDDIIPDRGQTVGPRKGNGSQRIDLGKELRKQSKETGGEVS